ncbi:PEP-utilizing enzyme [Streptomyces neyagawaensis]|uniref:PEP-utilizing enzyme n=1 Tax=Streptomyces neyagawaensis TaxID=42238 RepID=UPI0006E3373A|nr:PEP-utilizing enzyme [Streptomyces neyagawaensis]MCL6737466.1 PEP-utilizing enzyme [Streptomyces neyagawaensis]MDE1688249.1 PEP-utilizing enzyme [Streptomyces neyagawaensis]
MPPTVRTAFPSPHELPEPPGAEGWQRLYPYHLLFQRDRREEDESAFWFCDSQHWPSVIKPFEATAVEFSVKGMGQFNTRYFVTPTAYGMDRRIHQGYCYLSPVAVPAHEVQARVPEFLQRAGHYFEHWQELLANWKHKVVGTIRELEAIRFTPLPDVQPFEEVEAGLGLDPSDTLLAGYDRLIALCHRNWQYHFEFLNLGYAAYLDFFTACKRWFPDMPDLGIAKMVQGVDLELFRPEEELRKLAELAVELGVDDVLIGPEPGPRTLEELGASPDGRVWTEAWRAARDPWFNFTSGTGFYSSDVYWRDDPSVPLHYIRDYVQRLRKGEPIDRNLAGLVAERERISAEYAALLEPSEYDVFEAKLRLARQAYPYVENHNFYIEHWTMGVFWRQARELSRLLWADGFWPAEDDMFYLTRDEVREALFDHVNGWATGRRPAGRTHWPLEVERRRRIMDALARRPPEPALGNLPESVTEPLSVMLWGITPERIRSWLDGYADGDLVGVPASPGLAVGTARIVRGPEDLPFVREGEVIVAPVTAPSWGPVFAKARAVVTDIGGVMSHAAIVCREYSLPAVTGTGTASTLITTGQRLRVDGGAGTVTVLDPRTRQTSEVGRSPS